MDHMVIMKKSWGLIPKILDGRKKIESRWGINKVAKVSRIQEFENLNTKKIREILEKYGGDDGISVSSLEKTIKWARKKHYCTLIYLEDPKKVKPFNIDKTGFGAGAAWISVSNIDKIKI